MINACDKQWCCGPGWMALKAWGTNEAGVGVQQALNARPSAAYENTSSSGIEFLISVYEVLRWGRSDSSVLTLNIYSLNLLWEALTTRLSEVILRGGKRVIKTLFRVKHGHITRSVVNLFYIPQDKRHSSAIIGIIKNPHHHHRHRRSTVRGGYSSVQSHKFYRIAHSTTTRRSEGPVLVGQWKNQHEAILVITPHRATDPLWYSNTFPFFFFFLLGVSLLQCTPIQQAKA